MHDVVFGLVVFVATIRNHAGGRGDRQEAFLNAIGGHRRLHIVDVELHGGLARVLDRPDADRIHRRGHAFLRIHLVVEGGETRTVGAATPGIVALERATLEAAHALDHILRPGNALAEFAVAGNVDSSRLLLRDDFAHFVLQLRLMGGLVHGLAGLFGAQIIDDRLRADKAADVRRQDTIIAVVHRGRLQYKARAWWLTLVADFLDQRAGLRNGGRPARGWQGAGKRRRADFAHPQTGRSPR